MSDAPITNEDKAVKRVSNRCEIVEARCWCILPENHDGAHECKCGGGWTFTERGDFYPTEWPSIITTGRIFPKTDEDKEIIARAKKDPNDTRSTAKEGLSVRVIGDPSPSPSKGIE